MKFRQKCLMASLITQHEFDNALSRYPSILKKISKNAKAGAQSLEELDEFRYRTAIANFNKNKKRTMEISDVIKLVEWKMHHGTFRPSLRKLVSSNSNDTLTAATKSAFDYYSKNKNDITGTLEKITKPLRGIGPATGSLLLSIHDPENIVFFSDELYRWLCIDGRKVSLRYTIKEFEKLYEKSKNFMSRIQCTPIELEKVAYVFIIEQDLSQRQQLSKSSKKSPDGLTSPNRNEEISLSQRINRSKALRKNEPSEVAQDGSNRLESIVKVRTGEVQRQQELVTGDFSPDIDFLNISTQKKRKASDSLKHRQKKGK
ncbi:hypothetical protein GcM3_007044 [Golovinomyces cichoracearum]|uniref:Uncharacterized protein n=1 Tax=Golovinomyces cichoracearum TaxID=62708 RepID=A0A420JAR2_9PEZI|nr:hypothetical protein GcM3_007044 [Golovinomyces cichoracearum]